MENMDNNNNNISHVAHTKSSTNRIHIDTNCVDA